MRIGFDAKRLFNNFTGLGNYSRTLVRHLANYYPEHAYHLFTPKISAHAETDIFRKEKPFQIHRPAGIGGALWRTFGLAFDLRRHGLDLYHGLSHELPIGIERSKIASVVTIHDLIYKIHPEYFPWLDRQVYDWKFRYACRVADAVVAISESTKRDIMQHFGTPEAKITVIYQTCHERFSRRCTTEEMAAVRTKYNLPADYLLYVGAVNRRKNLLRIVQALELLPSAVCPPLVVVGDGSSYLRQVKDYLSGKAVERLVQFRPRIDFHDNPAIYQQALALVYPSEYEGFGIPVIEALAGGTPVITSLTSSMPEAGGHGSWYVNPASVAEIAHAVEQVVSDAALRQKMSADGLQYVQKFEKQRVTTQMMQLYLSLR
jgi:glycosyltransferase involved in cell wall biosynthesis